MRLPALCGRAVAHGTRPPPAQGAPHQPWSLLQTRCSPGWAPWRCHPRRGRRRRRRAAQTARSHGRTSSAPCAGALRRQRAAAGVWRGPATMICPRTRVACGAEHATSVQGALRPARGCVCGAALGGKPEGSASCEGPGRDTRRVPCGHTWCRRSNATQRAVRLRPRVAPPPPYRTFLASWNTMAEMKIAIFLFRNYEQEGRVDTRRSRSQVELKIRKEQTNGRSTPHPGDTRAAQHRRVGTAGGRLTGAAR